jgi:hypothetical protein
LLMKNNFHQRYLTCLFPQLAVQHKNSHFQFTTNQQRNISLGQNLMYEYYTLGGGMSGLQIYKKDWHMPCFFSYAMVVQKTKTGSTDAILANFAWDIFINPPYSPDLASSSLTWNSFFMTCAWVVLKMWRRWLKTSSVYR